MNMVCLDTSFIIDVLRGDPKAKVRLDGLIAGAGTDTITIATPTLMELQTGLALNKRGSNEEGIINNIKASAIMLPLDADAATRAGTIEAALILAGESIPPVDIMIGAIALLHGETVLTRNKRHFERIPGLAVASY